MQRTNNAPTKFSPEMFYLVVEKYEAEIYAKQEDNYPLQMEDEVIASFIKQVKAEALIDL